MTKWMTDQEAHDKKKNFFLIIIFLTCAKLTFHKKVTNNIFYYTRFLYILSVLN